MNFRMKRLRSFQKELVSTIPVERMASMLGLTKKQSDEFEKHGFEYFCESLTAEEWKGIIEESWGYMGIRYDVNNDVVYDTDIDGRPEWWFDDCMVVQMDYTEEFPKFEVYADDEFNCLLGEFVPKNIGQTMEVLALLDAKIIPEHFDLKKKRTQ